MKFLPSYRQLLRTAIGCSFLLFSTLSLAQPVQILEPVEGFLRLLGAQIIVGNGEVIESGEIFIRDGLIQYVGRVRELQLQAPGTTVDVNGKTIMPAMIDAHAHLGYEGYTSWGGDNYSKQTMIEHLQRYTYYGFSAVFSAGSDPDDFSIALQQSQGNEEFVGARFVFAAGMAPPGQGPNPNFLSQALAVEQSLSMTILRGAGTPEEGRQAVRDIAAKNIEFIKIWVDDRGGSQVKLAPPIYRAIIDEAQQQGIEVFVHQQAAQDMQDLIDAGTSGFLHGRIGSSMDTALATQLRQSDVFVVPNLGLGELRRERVGDDEFLQDGVSEEVVARLQTSYENRRAPNAPAPEVEQQLREAFGRLLDAEVEILLGTDAGAVPDHFFGYTGHRELEIFVRLGMSPMQAIVAATANPARRLGLDDLGTLEQGKRADFIVLDESPLTDIRNTRSIIDVYSNGQRVDRDRLKQNWVDD